MWAINLSVVMQQNNSAFTEAGAGDFEYSEMSENIVCFSRTSCIWYWQGKNLMCAVNNPPCPIFHSKRGKSISFAAQNTKMAELFLHVPAMEKYSILSSTTRRQNSSLGILSLCSQETELTFHHVHLDRIMNAICSVHIITTITFHLILVSV